ncbi:MAG: TfoX/Sxy family protein [Candidatus Dormibacteraeota bacterium]|nr:TfoX/Sxy family protein [Candidatus Dormibacteraeota bacterium]
MPKSSDEAKQAFLSLVPDAPSVLTRPMFGNLAAFVNGNMFAGLFGERLFVRLPPAASEDLLAHGGAQFEPMPGRAMTGYITIPDGWLTEPEPAAHRMTQALEFTSGLPPKAGRTAVKKSSQKR